MFPGAGGVAGDGVGGSAGGVGESETGFEIGVSRLIGDGGFRGVWPWGFCAMLEGLTVG